MSGVRRLASLGRFVDSRLARLASLGSLGARATQNSTSWSWSERCTKLQVQIGRVEIIPLHPPVSQHQGAIQHRKGGNYPAALASIPAPGLNTTMLGPEQGSKLQSWVRALDKTKEKPSPVWYRRGRVFSLVCFSALFGGRKWQWPTQWDLGDL